MKKTGPQVPERWRIQDGLIPKGRYIDPDFLRLEYERLFPRVWQMACRLEEIPNAGDFYEYEIGDESILVVNRGGGALKAYFNACPHRGTRLARGEGRVEEFTCPFHAWRFDLDGQCTYVHDVDDFGPGFRLDTVCLAECRVDTWGGWAFVHMDPNAEPLAEFLAPLPAALDPFLLERMRFRWHKSTVMSANWKTVIDAFIEGYHTGGRHPQMIRTARMDYGPASVDELRTSPYTPSQTVGRHSRFTYGARPAADDGEMPRTVDPDDRKRLLLFTEYNAFSLKALANERDVRAARRVQDAELPEGESAFVAFQRFRREEAEADGITWPTITPEQFLAGQGNWHVFPSMVLLVEPGCALGYRVRPNGNDPDSSIFEAWTLELYPDDVPSGAPHERFERWQDHDGWGNLLPQDFENFPDVTAGMHSRAFRGLRLNPKQEAGIRNAHVVADTFLFGDAEE